MPAHSCGRQVSLLLWNPDGWARLRVLPKLIPDIRDADEVTWEERCEAQANRTPTASAAACVPRVNNNNTRNNNSGGLRAPRAYLAEQRRGEGEKQQLLHVGQNRRADR